MAISPNRSLKWVLPLLLLVGCGEQQREGKMLCSMEGHAYLIERDLTWIVRRVPSADQLCPKR